MAPRRPSGVQPGVRGLVLANADTGGSGGGIWLKIALATVIVLLIIGAFVYFSETPPVASGEVVHLTAYPIHRVSHAIPEGSKAAKAEQTFDEMIVIADVRIRNLRPGPLFLSDMAALLSLPGEEHRSLAANANDFNRVFVAYPQLVAMKEQPLLRDTTIAEGESAEGQLIFHYPITKDQWDLRRSLDIKLSFLHQNDLTLPAPQ
jgi:hypothetical protein